MTGQHPLECFITSNRYGTYCVPAASKHRPAAATILRGDVWEAETLAFLCANCGTGDIIHAGTYFGDFLPALSKAAAHGADIWAFEPSSENFRCADITLKLNEIHNVRLTHAGLGAGEGYAPLRTGTTGARAAGGGSEIVAEKLAGFDYEEVRIVAIDEAVPQHRPIAILQLDVEKYEQQALTGALATIRRCLPVLVLETLPADPRWFTDNIVSLGYEEIGPLDKNRAFCARKVVKG